MSAPSRPRPRALSLAAVLVSVAVVGAEPRARADDEATGARPAGASTVKPYRVARMTIPRPPLYKGASEGVPRALVSVLVSVSLYEKNTKKDPFWDPSVRDSRGAAILVLVELYAELAARYDLDLASEADDDKKATLRKLRRDALARGKERALYAATRPGAWVARMHYAAAQYAAAEGNAAESRARYFGVIKEDPTSKYVRWAYLAFGEQASSTAASAKGTNQAEAKAVAKAADTALAKLAP